LQRPVQLGIGRQAQAEGGGVELLARAMRAAVHRIVRVGAAPGQGLGAPAAFERQLRGGRLGAVRQRAQADPRLERAHQLEAQLAHEARRAVGVGHAVHAVEAGRGAGLEGGRGELGEQALALVVGVGGGVQRQQDQRLAALDPGALRDADVVGRQALAVPGIHADRGAVRVGGVQPGEILGRELVGAGEAGGEQGAVLRQRGLVMGNGSDAHHLKIQ
jgi:hypothetical protein